MTHEHPTYGLCTIIERVNGQNVIIQTATGTAIVPRSSLRAL